MKEQDETVSNITAVKKKCFNLEDNERKKSANYSKNDEYTNFCIFWGKKSSVMKIHRTTV